MQVDLNQACLVLDDKTGGILSYQSHGVEMISPMGASPVLFEVRFRDPAGEFQDISSNLAEMSAERSENKLTLHYRFPAEYALSITIDINAKPDGSVAFGYSMNHQRLGYLECIQLPLISVRPDFIATGGKGTLLWPGLEGILVEDPQLRKKTGNEYYGLEYPYGGWSGYYPGLASMQFMAYMRDGVGMYIAHHDSGALTKEIAYHAKEYGVRMIFRTYPGAISAGHYTLPYDIILKPYKGEWYEAAQIYRDWIEQSKLPLPPKLKDRQDREPWLEESPVVITYPVTGVGHHAGKTEPNEFFPFTNALPAIEKAAQKTDSTLLVVPMQWEGTAPWAPPYVWPPRGGEQNMREFADALHRSGHHLGLYCSGLAWTNIANTGDGTYNRTEEFERRHLITEMCQGPKGEYGCSVCNCDDLRWGYDFCVTSKVAREIVYGELKKIAAAGVDYVQLLDQNLGAAAYHCYDARHGHPPAPGPWQAAAMRDLLSTFRHDLAQAGYPHVIMGCETAAAETYIEHLPLNDLRFFIGYMFGRPVSAFAYVFHEYTTNFMGNQCGVTDWMDQSQSPHHLALRFAHGFVSGDLLTVVFKSGGEMHWAWCTKWDVTPPNQDKHWNFVKNLNAWRRGTGKPFLYFGRMLKPHAVMGAEIVPLHMYSGKSFRYSPDYPAVMTSRWESPSGEVAQFLVNYMDQPQTITLNCTVMLDLFENPESKAQLIQPGQKITIAPMSAVMVKERQ